jgi:exopolyphosphatase/pppGpp-phosphohydrolase
VAGVIALVGCGSSSSKGGAGAADAAVDAPVDAAADAKPSVVCPGDGGFALRMDAPVDAKPARDSGPGAIECTPDSEERLGPAAGALRHCAFDIGSKNVKLSLTQMTPGSLSSLASQRDCKAQKNLGDKTYDQKTEMRLPLPAKDLDDLVSALNDYKALCERDGARVVAAVASEWARRATNQDEIKAAIKARVGVDLDIITGDQEGFYGYTAATRGTFNKIILDSGSRSFQVAWWPEKDPSSSAVSIGLGSDEASDRFFANPMYTSYAAAHAAYLEYLRGLAKDDLGPLKQLIKAGKLDSALLSLGDSGLALAVDGSLIDPCNGHWVDGDVYDAKTAERRGSKRTLKASDVKAFLTRLSQNDAWFAELRSDRLKKAYGNKVTAALALIAYLLDELGVDELWFVSAELAEGVILEKVGK